MNLSQYLSEERGRQVVLAKAIGAHVPDLSKWASGGRPIPKRFAVPIETHTGGLVTRQEMFPEDWKTYWPELPELSAARSVEVGATSAGESQPPPVISEEELERIYIAQRKRDGGVRDLSIDTRLLRE
jgi:DNA-binding transcriptional regulator YdaS (Cro superfamily)